MPLITWIAHAGSKLEGEIVFDGSIIPVRHIIKLIKMGATRDQLQDNYPELTKEMLDFSFVMTGKLYTK